MAGDEEGPPGDPPPVTVEHVVLGVVNWWSTKFSHKQVQAMVEKNFDQEEILDAQKVLANALGESVEPKKRQNSQLRPAVEAQAEDICDKVDTLIKENRMPRVLIPCDQLGRVPLATLSTSDEQSVCARLESLEARMTKMCETVTKAQTNQLHVTQAFVNRNVPNVVVTPAGNGGVPSVHQPQGYAAAVAGTAGGQPAGGVGQPQGLHVAGQVRGVGQGRRERSPSLKRKNPEDEENKEPDKPPARKPRKFGNGASQVGLDDIAPGGLAGPVDFYIGNTDKRADGDIITRVLKKCAAPLDGGKDLEVLEVELLTLEENPRSKCWRISVPFKFKGLMEKDELYLPGWKHRKFFGTRRKPQDNMAKKSRSDNMDQVTAMIEEREKEAEAIRQSHESEQARVASAPPNLHD